MKTIVWIAILLAGLLAGCGKLFGIDVVDYAGPAPDGAGSSGDGGGDDGSGGDGSGSANLGALTITVKHVDSAKGGVSNATYGISVTGDTATTYMIPIGTAFDLVVGVSNSMVLAWDGACYGQNGVMRIKQPAQDKCTITMVAATNVTVVIGSNAFPHAVAIPEPGSVGDTGSPITVSDFTGDACVAGQLCVFGHKTTGVDPITVTATGVPRAGCLDLVDWKQCSTNSDSCEFPYSTDPVVTSLFYKFVVVGAAGCNTPP